MASDGWTPRPGTAVIVVHDASPRGCALVLRISATWASRPSTVGCGRRDVDGPSHQVIEGAPARLPRDLSTLLDRAEVDWLLSGRRVEVATLPPEVAMDRVRAAISRLDPLHGGAPQPAR